MSESQITRRTADHAWIITRDIEAEKPLVKHFSEVGTHGPDAATPELVQLAQQAGTPFRLLDGDFDVLDWELFAIWQAGAERLGYRFSAPVGQVNPVLYEGRLYDPTGEHKFAPIDEFGDENFGCTVVQYQDTAGNWVTYRRVYDPAELL